MAQKAWVKIPEKYGKFDTGLGKDAKGGDVVEVAAHLVDVYGLEVVPDPTKAPKPAKAEAPKEKGEAAAKPQA